MEGTARTSNRSREERLCPRCSGYIPNNDSPGAFPGAMSRLDSATEICSACGVEEAIEQFTSFVAQRGPGVTDMSNWPVESVRSTRERGLPTIFGTLDAGLAGNELHAAPPAASPETCSLPASANERSRDEQSQA